MEWTADILSDPTRNHDLCVEISEGDHYRARIQRDAQGAVELVCYQGGFTIPALWLVGLIQRFIEDTDASPAAPPS